MLFKTKLITLLLSLSLSLSPLAWSSPQFPGTPGPLLYTPSQQSIWQSQGISIQQQIANNGDYLIHVRTHGNNPNIQFRLNGRHLHVFGGMLRNNRYRTPTGQYYSQDFSSNISQRILLPQDTDLSRMTYMKHPNGISLRFPRTH